MPPPKRASMQKANIYDLTARESAWVGLPHAELLIDAFKAIDQKHLQAHFDESPPTGVTWRSLVNQAITALERDPHFFARWFRLVMVDLSDYRRWRDQTSKQYDSVGSKRRPRASFNRVLSAMENYIAAERAAGRPASQKRAWECAKAVIPGATYRQVIEAMSAAEGGKKKQGRPRASSRKAS
jgi:hypothetical protein